MKYQHKFYRSEASKEITTIGGREYMSRLEIILDSLQADRNIYVNNRYDIYKSMRQGEQKRRLV